jgi:glycosyltransferase involved in cell wall biosynthesis
VRSSAATAILIVGEYCSVDPSGPILINARAAARAQVGGVERWAREMVARLPALRPGAYAVARPPRGLAHRAGHAWEQVALPALAARRRAALVYSPANLAPLAWPRNAVAIHDAVALRHPEWYSPTYVAWQRRALPAAARRARLVLTVSDFSRAEIVDTLGADPLRVAVVPGGVDERFSPAADPEPARRALGLAGPYVLTLSTAGPRKNRAALAATGRALRTEGIELVAAGGERGYIRHEEPPDAVRAVGYVPDELLPGLYAGAEAFVLPSRHEGFGLPCLEAMASGVPVVAADRGALPETCGDAALLVDPDDPDAVAAAVLRAAGDEAERGRLRAAGLERARSFTWERAAAATDALLARAAAG